MMGIWIMKFIRASKFICLGGVHANWPQVQLSQRWQCPEHGADFANESPVWLQKLLGASATALDV